MASKTCPLCGERLKNNYCESCGYNVPESEELSALYNYDPSDYPPPQEEKAPIREMYPENMQAEEIYPNRPEPIKFKVRNDEGKTVKGTYNSPQNPYANNQPQNPYANNAPANNGNPYANRGAPRQNNPPVPANRNPYANLNSPYQKSGTSGTGQISGYSELFKKYWWLMLICFLAPIPGVIVLSVFKRTIGQKYNWIFVLAIVLGFLLPPY